MPTESRRRGDAAEAAARQYLEQQGLKFRERNFHCRWGELDLIMEDRGCLVFVEVRSRSSAAFGGAAASITASKRQRIIRAASVYAAKHRLENRAMRFDVVTIDNAGKELQWLKQAFDASRPE